MATRFGGLVLPLVALALVGCPANNAPPSSTDTATLATARQAVQKRMDDYLAVLRANQFDSLGSYWTKDAEIFENAMEIKDRATFDAIVAQEKRTLKLDSINLSTSEIFAHDGGMVAYQYGHYVEGFHYLDGKKPPEIAHNNFVARWIKDTDGMWRMHRFLATPMPAPAAASARMKAPTKGPTKAPRMK